MVSAIVLAAGLSTRMGNKNKLCLPLGKMSIIQTVIDHLCQSSVGEIIVVLGHESELVEAQLRSFSVKCVLNTDYHSGQISSIQSGIRSISKASLGFMVCLGDMPFLEASEYHYLVKTFLKKSQKLEQVILCPTYQERLGNPVVFGSYYQQVFLQASTLSRGKNILHNHLQNIHKVAMNKPHILMDIDSDEAYKKVMQNKL